jgi:hypothetical protein
MRTNHLGALGAPGAARTDLLQGLLPQRMNRRSKAQSGGVDHVKPMIWTPPPFTPALRTRILAKLLACRASCNTKP